MDNEKSILKTQGLAAGAWSSCHNPWVFDWRQWCWGSCATQWLPGGCSEVLA
ncbi:hypothetical protein BIFGAL_03166 [Bifidobacterium gallicum DSM 20093 = LMG 11596]|uniref:Uncharacterized protein n=1 Tax=Bifidobacterium gallicum DSM 20093 = LMG 11596 TaxID=561180 RepID=D1NTK8_9BIFI|nr:hypothetical protein BIFGAL_03166 [Bifidobacterium gallicum DSM 20093 = LMG 11596]